MKRVDLIKELISEGFTDKFLSRLTDKQLNDLSERVLSEQTLNIPKDDNQSIEKAKQEKKQFVTYEEEEEVDEASSPAQQAAIAINMKKKGKEPKNEEMDEWVESVVKENYHTNVTTKKEIYEIIGSISDGLGDAKNMFSVDEQQPSPAKPDRDTPVRERPTTRPERPKRRNPFEPKHKPGPKAELPKELTFKSLGFNFKQAAE